VSLFGKGYVINPGSAGLPRDVDWHASFATLDIESGEVRDATIHRVIHSMNRAMQAGKATGLLRGS
jgi:predicted phosphodiesterase